jgi:uncharacterized SAM-binding protein YcdF (DUF218 family)
MRRADIVRVTIEAIAAVIIVILVDVTISGYLLFTNSKVDELEHADAIVVLGGEHDGREEYGIQLAAEGWAPTVVLSNPYLRGDQVMERACQPREDIEVICVRPPLLTTRGEAKAVRAMAEERSWEKIIVVSWRYHLPRARLIFRRCYSERRDAIVMRPVPREYRYSLLQWDGVYMYQFAGYAKAALQGDCS